MITAAYDELRRELLSVIEAERLRADEHDVREVAVRLVDACQRRAGVGHGVVLSDPKGMVERLVRSVVELGPLTELLARTDVEEIFIEGARVSYIDETGALQGFAVPTSEEENRHVVERLLAATERQLNVQYPLVQARVLDGTARLTAAIPPVAEHLSVTIRRYIVRHVHLGDLVARGAMSRRAATFLWGLMQCRSRVVVSGQPGAGKTTLLAALLAAMPPQHCVRVCEEIRELSVPLLHGAYYEVRPPGLDGGGEISLRALLKFVLAMRPDRIVVGEVRGAEAFELSRAVNAGSGFACTVHANRAVDAMHALVNAALMAGENVSESVVRSVFGQTIDVIVHVERHAGASGSTPLRREVAEIVAVVPSLGDTLTTEPLFVRAAPGAPLEWTGTMPSALAARIAQAIPAGIDLEALFDADTRSVA